tara:strand:- start:8759 stop:11386 length:2628 start_codon:yes stop_codon:yes gene_type:complete
MSGISLFDDFIKKREDPERGYSSLLPADQEEVNSEIWKKISDSKDYENLLLTDPDKAEYMKIEVTNPKSFEYDLEDDDINFYRSLRNQEALAKKDYDKLEMAQAEDDSGIREPISEDLIKMMGKTDSEGKVIVDQETGGSIMSRAVINAKSTDNIYEKFDELRKVYPHLRMRKDRSGELIDFEFLHPETQMWTRFDPDNFEPFMDILVDEGRTVAGIAGETAGAAAGGALGGPPGAIVGAGLGSNFEQAYIKALEYFSGMNIDNKEEKARSMALNSVLAMGSQAVSPLVGRIARRGYQKAIAGGKKGIERTKRAWADFQTVDKLYPSIGMATGRRFWTGLQGILEGFPGGAAVFARKASEANKAMQSFLKKKSVEIGGKGLTPEKTGSLIKKASESWVEYRKKRAGKMFDELSAYFDENEMINTPTITRTLNGLLMPIKTAKNLSEYFANPEISNLAKAYKLDVMEIITKHIVNDNAAREFTERGLDLKYAKEILAKTGKLPPGMEGMLNIENIMVKKEGLSWETLKSMRSEVGNLLGNYTMMPKISRGELKSLYGAISKEMKVAAERKGPEALKLFQKANKQYKEMITRIDNILESVSKKFEPEKVFQMIESKSKVGSTYLKDLKATMKPEEWKVVVGTVLDRMGMALPGVKSETGEEALDFTFSIGRFLTDYNKITKGAKDVLFSGKEMGNLRKSLDALGRAASRVREVGKVYQNPSGTAGDLVGKGLYLGGAMKIGGGVTGLLYASGYDFSNPRQEGLQGVLMDATSILSGTLVTILGAKGAARWMTNPERVKWLTKALEIEPNKLAAHLGRLVKTVNRDDLEDALSVKKYIEAFTVVPRGLETNRESKRYVQRMNQMKRRLLNTPMGIGTR